MPRKAADKLLLEQGPQFRERVLLEIQFLVQPGLAARTALKTRRLPEDDERHASRRGDVYEVGARRVATSTINNAMRDGKWFLNSEGKIQHRDWQQPAVEPEPITHEQVSGFVVPTMDVLEGASRLLMATDWEKAAIVAAFVEVVEHGGDRTSKRTFALAPKEFAALGIAGLKSDNTVRRYVEAWQSTGLPRPHPGDTVDLPQIRFPAVPRPVVKNSITASNDAREWASWLRKNKSPELVAQIAVELLGDEKQPPRRASLRLIEGAS